MIQLKDLTLSRDKKCLLKKANLTIHRGQKVGLMGANGSGKSSLIQLLKNEIASDEGEVSIAKNLQMAHLRQDIPLCSTSALDYVLEGDAVYTGLQERIRVAEAAQDGMAIAECYMELGEIDGYTIPSKASQVLHGLGFSVAEMQQPLDSFSGGWQMRLNLAQVLLSRADILLLDEPTNHLDMEAIIWLEEWLQKSTATILLVSHDRDFLDHVVTHIAHLYQQQLKLYVGTYSQFEDQRAEQLILQQAAHEKQEAARAHVQKYIDRFRYSATKARQAQSRIKLLEKMEKTVAVQIENPFHFTFKPIEHAGNPMLSLDNVSLGYGDDILLTKINGSICDGDRIGLIGPNGAGKSTFIKLLAQQIAVKKGEVRSTNKIKIGYFAQHQLELLHPDESPMYHLLQLDRRISDSRARQYLGSFLFSNDDVFRPVHTFSGGEKARLVLSLIIWQAPNLLLLDEPTNHLDLEMREALNMALQDYEGALVLVSHDRHLLSCVTNDLWLVADGSVSVFEGDLDDYRFWFNDRDRRLEQAAQMEKPPATKFSDPKNDAKTASQKKQLEKNLADAAVKLAALDQQLNDPEIYQDAHKTQRLSIMAEREIMHQSIISLEAQLLQIYAK